MILERCEAQHGKDRELRATVERVVNEVVPRLLQDGHLGGTQGITPVVVHGDLWSGNKGSGVFIGRATRRNIGVKEADEAQGEDEGGGEDLQQGEIIFDPSAVYAHNEYEFGIMKMFGGFSSSFFKEYHSIVPRTEPVEEYEDRVKLYESYHHLNHHAIFGGGGYKSGAMSLLRGLLKRYGDGGGKV